MLYLGSACLATWLSLCQTVIFVLYFYICYIFGIYLLYLFSACLATWLTLCQTAFQDLLYLYLYLLQSRICICICFQPVWWPDWLCAKPLHKICSRRRKLGQSQVRNTFALQSISWTFPHLAFTNSPFHFPCVLDWTETLGHLELFSYWGMYTQGDHKYLCTNIWRQNMCTQGITLKSGYKYSRSKIKGYSKGFIQICYKCFHPFQTGSVTIAPTQWQKPARLKRSMFRYHH